MASQLWFSSQGDHKGSSVFVSLMEFSILLQRIQVEAKNSTRSEFLESNPASATFLLSNLKVYLLSELVSPPLNRDNNNAYKL